MFQTVLQTLSSIDIRTVLLVLVGGNLVSAILIFAFMRSTPFARDKPLLLYCLYSRAVLAVAFALFFCRGLIPDLLSVNMGNSLLLFAFFWESRVILAAISEERNIYKVIMAAGTLVCVTAFNVAEYVRPDPAIRITVSSFCTFLILCVPTACMALTSGIGSFKKAISFLYVAFLVLVFFRSLTGMEVANSLLDGGNIIHSLTFLALIFMMSLSLPAYLLMAKETADKALLRVATTDALTGLRNRHSFFDLADQLYQSHIVSRSYLSVLFMDIDNFKQINDVHGHAFGDAVLVRLADIFKKALRPMDLSCRYGGEEFVVFLARADACAATTVGHRIMREISETIFQSHPDFIFTVSVGVSCGIPQEGEQLKDYIAQADEALYAAKGTGKNKVVTIMPSCREHELNGRESYSGSIKVNKIMSTPDFILAELQPIGKTDENIQ